MTEGGTVREKTQEPLEHQFSFHLFFKIFRLALEGAEGKTWDDVEIVVVSASIRVLTSRESEENRERAERLCHKSPLMTMTMLLQW